MRELDRKKNQVNCPQKRNIRSPRQDNRSLEEDSCKIPNRKETGTTRSSSRSSSILKPATKTTLSTNRAKGTKPSGNADVVRRSEDAVQLQGTLGRVKEKKKNADADRSGELEKHESGSDYESVSDTASSLGDSQTADDEEPIQVSRIVKQFVKKKHLLESDMPRNSDYSTVLPEELSYFSDNKSVNTDIYPASESSQGLYDNTESIEKPKEETCDEVSAECQSIVEDDHEAADAEADANGADGDGSVMNEKIEQMEKRIEKLEDELREVAALEVSLYSVVSEHGTSSHKIHTPAWRLSRLYIHASKHWTQTKTERLAKNIVSELFKVSRTCGHDLSRLTYWLSNTVLLREMISQGLGNSCQISSLKFAETNIAGMRNSLAQFNDDWHQMETFTAGLVKIESWIFMRIVNSIWWQILTPKMQYPVAGSTTHSWNERLLGPGSDIERQGSIAMNWWKNAFQDAFQRLCPARASGGDCGCVPVLARMIMEECVVRLDVAMFNAILRESAHRAPSNPVSDPIVDPSVLPIHAGELSFGSGARLKNTVGNWSRWLCDCIGMGRGNEVDVDHQSRVGRPKCFGLLDELSDLLMLPKDMVIDRSIRKEVCPSITLPLIKRVLCNFSPDEFCPEHVPGEILEALNAEIVVEQRLSGSGDYNRSFPYTAEAVVYRPPAASGDVAGMMREIEENPEIRRFVISQVEGNNGYMSDDELINEINNSMTMSTSTGDQLNMRYELLQEVWFMRNENFDDNLFSSVN